MKKISVFFVAAASMLLASCGAVSLNNNASSTAAEAGNAAAASLGAVASEVLTNMATNAANGSSVGNMLQSVLGLDKVTKANLIGTWTYSQPGCAFTSEKLLAQAGGEVIASSIKSKLQSTYQKVGINSSSTSITFNQDGTFAAKVAGKSFSGNYTFNESTYEVTLQGLLLSFHCYAKKNSDGIGLLFEAKKLLTLLQTAAALSGNSTLNSISDLSKNYDGLRIGFDYKK